MSGEAKSGGNGLGFGRVLFIVFLVLKLTEAIDWSWWWVAAPLWIPAAILGLIGLPMLITKALK